jgi:4-amino-4-deoxy-L-arabinose transferase-like glycosyltransferase
MQPDYTSQSDRSGADRLWLVAILLLGLAPRAYLLFITNFGIESDEAIVGLMAKHFIENAVMPVFYYGQSYMGSLEPLFVAAAFKLTGVGNVGLKLVPLCFSLLHIYLVYRLAIRFTSISGARIAALLCSLAPSALIHWSVKARGGFIELVVIGTACLILAVDVIEIDRHRRVRAFFLGLLLGLGWWVNNQIVYYGLPIVVLVSWSLFRNLGVSGMCRLGLLGALGFFIGSAAFWYQNIAGDPQWATFEVLFGSSGEKHPLAYLNGFFNIAIPIIIGARRFWSEHDVFPNATLLAAIVYCLAAVYLLWLCFSVQPRERRCSILLLLSFFASVALVFSLSSFGWLSRAPRYILPLYSVIFVAAGVLYGGLRRRKSLGASTLGFVLVASLLIVQTASNFNSRGFVVPGQPSVYAGQRVMKDHQPLYDWLKEEGYDHIWTNYWIGYRTAFETKEKVTFSRFGRPRSLRLPEYENPDVLKGKPPVYVLVPQEALPFAVQLRQFGYDFRVIEVAGYHIIDQLRSAAPRGRQLSLSSDDVVVSAGEETSFALIDGDVKTRWQTGEPQNKEMFILVRFAEPTIVSGFDLDFDGYVHDAPRLLQVYCEHGDGTSTIVSNMDQTKAYFDLHEKEWFEIPNVWTFRFPERQCTEMRFLQRSSSPVYDWSIAELRMYGEAQR